VAHGPRVDERGADPSAFLQPPFVSGGPPMVSARLSYAAEPWAEPCFGRATGAWGVLWAVDHNFEAAQWISERQRHYPRPDQSPGPWPEYQPKELTIWTLWTSDCLQASRDAETGRTGHGPVSNLGFAAYQYDLSDHQHSPKARPVLLFAGLCVYLRTSRSRCYDNLRS